MNNHHYLVWSQFNWVIFKNKLMVFEICNHITRKLYQIEKWISNMKHTKSNFWVHRFLIFNVPFSICMYIEDVYYNHYSNEDESNTNHITSNSQFIYCFHTVILWTLWKKQITLIDKHIILHLNSNNTYEGC